MTLRGFDVIWILCRFCCLRVGWVLSSDSGFRAGLLVGWMVCFWVCWCGRVLWVVGRCCVSRWVLSFRALGYVFVLTGLDWCDLVQVSCILFLLVGVGII